MWRGIMYPSEGVSFMAQADESPPRLLVVEDDQETCDVVLDLLIEEGYTVVSAASLDEALAQVNSQVFDLILADVIGWTTHAPLQAVEQLRDQAQPTPVGLFTSWNLSEEAVKAQGFVRLLSWTNALAPPLPQGEGWE